MLLAHVVDPLSVRSSNNWAAGIAADLVSRSMVPHKFTTLTSGVTIVIGARDSQGNITDFFADDQRDADVRRTYFAKTAIISHDEKGYLLRMHQGAVQYLSAEKRFSQVSFDGYDLPMDQLASSGDDSDPLAATTSIDLLLSGDWNDTIAKTLWRRTAEGIRVIAMCLFVAGLAAFPTGARRGFVLPVEIAVLGAAFIERAISSYLPVP
eukprot:gene3735-4946_t